MTEIKFCGLTRREDVDHAVALGAAYVGVIFAGGPRLLTADRARDVLSDVPKTVQRVGVFAEQSDDDIARTTDLAKLDVIQLHADWDPERVARLARLLGRRIWPVVRLQDAVVPTWIVDAFQLGDAVLIDALVAGLLGGTGVALPWPQLATTLGAVRGHGRVVLAGGLRPENVGIAVAALHPDVVDVSSGVESSPGIKDHDRMRAFRNAVRPVSIPT